MFSRIKEAIRIISYQEPESGPDAIIAPEASITATPEGKTISRVLEFVVAALVIGWTSGRLGDYLIAIGFAKHTSLSAATVIGSVAVLSTIILSSISKDLET
jgi:hypothetical protein